MQSIEQLADDLRTLLAATWPTVRLSAAGSDCQFQQELRQLHRDQLPGIIIAFNRTAFSGENTLRECGLSVVLIDRFRAGSESRARALLQAAETFFTIFPPTGRMIGDGFCLPGECRTIATGGELFRLVLDLTITQGV
ncbi:MAG: hypothetical protein IJC73_01340 [Lentisphaeria bacterium]|nr:hypothetical protein [Lentisphaeria bacterium]